MVSTIPINIETCDWYIPLRDQSAPRRVRYSSAATMTEAKTGWTPISSRPMACHWAPWPVKTKETPGGRKADTGWISGLESFWISSDDVAAETATFHERNDRRWQSVYASLPMTESSSVSGRCSRYICRLCICALTDFSLCAESTNRNRTLWLAIPSLDAVTWGPMPLKRSVVVAGPSGSILARSALDGLGGPSSTTWQLVPPKPKLLMLANRFFRGHGSWVRGTYSFPLVTMKPLAS